MKILGDLMGHICDLSQGKKVLYVGVGDMQGGVSGNARSTHDRASEWYGIDNNANLASDNPDLNIILLDLDHPIRTALPRVDIVVITEVLEHLESPVATLRDLGRALPGCTIVGSVPNALSFGRIISALWSPRRYDVFDGHHLMVFNRYTLKKTLMAAHIGNVEFSMYDQHMWLRPLLQWRPDFARGLFFKGVFPQPNG